VICLQGDLGAGKTTLRARTCTRLGLARFSFKPNLYSCQPISPRDGSKLFHLDTYRLDSVPEAEELDLDDMLAEGALIIEWPERLGNLIPKEHLWIALSIFGRTPSDEFSRARQTL
jgi:tRNA threonylcarbamoyladenosine biosynthesis protein TsaE